VLQALAVELHDATLLARGRRDPEGYRVRAVEAGTAQMWICTSCGFIYDPADGDPDGGIAPGTAFQDIPDDWFCPVCGARKRDFEPYED
jgi:rubredoxin